MSDKFFLYYESSLTSKSEKSENDIIITEPVVKMHQIQSNIINSNINEKASSYEILKFIQCLEHSNNKKYEVNFIINLSYGYFLISTYDKIIFIYNEHNEKTAEITFPNTVNSCLEIEGEKNIIKFICCSIYTNYLISYDIQNNKIDIQKYKTFIECESNLTDTKNDSKIKENSQVYLVIII